MNLFDLRPGYTRMNDVPHTGARLVFRWKGPAPVAAAPPNPAARNCLYDQHPWRMFVGPDLAPDLMQTKLLARTNKLPDSRPHFIRRMTKIIDFVPQ